MGASEWVRVAVYDDVPEDGTLGVEPDGRSVCLYKLSGEVFATDNKCTHGDADLSDGLIQDGALIECPLHEGTFDIRTGKAMSAPCDRDIRCHAVRIDDGAVFIRSSPE